VRARICASDREAGRRSGVRTVAQAVHYFGLFATTTVVFVGSRNGSAWLGTMSPVLRTFVLATVAVPIVIYGLVPYLHKLRVRLVATGRGSS
jgi:hypothetical protein